MSAQKSWKSKKGTKNGFFILDVNDLNTNVAWSYIVICDIIDVLSQC